MVRKIQQTLCTAAYTWYTCLTALDFYVGACTVSGADQQVFRLTIKLASEIFRERSSIRDRVIRQSFSMMGSGETTQLLRQWPAPLHSSINMFGAEPLA